MSLARDARNFLAQQTDVTDLLGSGARDEADPDWDTWIFIDTPEVMIESTGKAMVVISTNGGWASANEHNTARFPRLLVDIWVDPTRSPSGAVLRKDAKERAEAIYKAIDKHLHMVNNSRPGGASVFWGTPEKISNKTGSRIVSSVRAGEPDYEPAIDDQGAYVAFVRYNVSL